MVCSADLRVKGAVRLRPRSCIPGALVGVMLSTDTPYNTFFQNSELALDDLKRASSERVRAFYGWFWPMTRMDRGRRTHGYRLWHRTASPRKWSTQPQVSIQERLRRMLCIGSLQVNVIDEEMATQRVGDDRYRGHAHRGTRDHSATAAGRGTDRKLRQLQRACGCPLRVGYRLLDILVAYGQNLT